MCMFVSGRVSIQGLHPSEAAFVDRIRHFRRKKAVPILKKDETPPNAAHECGLLFPDLEHTSDVHSAVYHIPGCNARREE